MYGMKYFNTACCRNTKVKKYSLKRCTAYKLNTYIIKN